MRRLRKVHILVNEDFYRLLDDHRMKVNNHIRKVTGVNRNMTMVSFTEVMARNKIIFPKINMKLFNNAKKQKGRRF